MIIIFLFKIIYVDEHGNLRLDELEYKKNII